MQAEAVWRAFEESGHLFTPYQRFDLLSPWQRLVGADEGARPFIVIAHDAEHRPLALLPLSLRQSHGVRTACFMGGKHTTFNMGLWNAEFAAQVGAADLDTLLAPHAQACRRARVGRSSRCAGTISKTRLRLLPRQSAVNGCPLLAMEPGGRAGSADQQFVPPPAQEQGKASYRRSPAIAIILPRPTPTSRACSMRSSASSRCGWPSKSCRTYSPSPASRHSSAARAWHRAGGGRAIDIHALECDDEVIAIFAGVADGQRFSMMFNTYTMSEHARYSPGLILMRYIIDRYAGAAIARSISASARTNTSGCSARSDEDDL